MRFRRRLTPEARVDLIPMIDVVFQLVVFFMVSSTFMLTPGISLVLPTSTTAAPVVMSEMVVTIASEDEIYINREGYTFEAFDQALAAIASEATDEIESVIIEGDESVTYELMITVLDVLSKNGFVDVNLKLREERHGQGAMIQTDKERLAISTAIALLLYAGIFAATGWLNILNPAEPREYIGPLSVEVTLQRPEPQTILPPEVEKPEPETTPLESPIDEPVAPVVTEPSRPESSPPAAESTGTSGQPAAESSSVGAPEAQQAVAVETPRYFGESETVSAPLTENGSEFFESVREGTPTDLRGETTIEYGSETSPENPVTEATSSIIDANEPSLADWSQLDTLQLAGEGNGSGDGGGSGVEGSTTESTGDLIEADSFAELMSERGVEARYDPDIRSSGLPGGLRSMKVPVEFTIRKDGTVLSVRVADTGVSSLNVQIAQALRRWKFAPIQQDIQQTARLLYLIEAR